MSIVSNASPLISLARIGRLDLLERLYETVSIPEAVWREVVVEGAGEPGAEAIASSGWIRRYEVANQPLVAALRQELDAGEAEAIALTLELGADLLLMDERLGREAAAHLGVSCVGVAGILIEAKRQGVVSRILPLLDALRTEADYRISDALYERMVRVAGESDS